MPLPPVQRKRKHFYLLEKFYTVIAIWTLPAFARLRLTPNQITLANLLNGLVIFGLIGARHWIPAAILIQLYLFLDILDGNLARYRQLTSPLGALLDHFGDRFFYNGVMVALTFSTATHWGWLVFFLFAHNLHAAAATYYIVPAIRKNPDFRRFAFKQALMDRGTILGMDLSSQDLILSLLLPTPWRVWIVPACSILYFADLLFRLAEVRRNRR
jgi:archaetidylinositol phosphate synthase